MRPVKNEDIPGLKSLWKKVFGDEDWYIDLFFENLFCPDSGLVIHNGDTLAAMGFLVPIGTYNGRECQVTYAVACDPDYRGKGYGAQISRALYELAGDGAVICPASKSLFEFYEAKAGYKTAFFTAEYTFNNNFISVNGCITPVTANKYAILRENKLANTPHIIFNDECIVHQEHICTHTGGGLFQIDDMGCCAVELWGDKAIVKELLVPDGELENAASFISQAFDGREMIVRCPAKDLTNSRPFAMAKFEYDNNLPLPWFGFAFD